MSDNGLQRARRRRRTRTVFVLLITAALVAGGFVYALGHLAPTLSSAGGSGTSSCTPKVLPQSRFTLNVYNASSIAGRANSVAARYSAGGYKVGVIGNDPYKEKVPDVAQVRYGSAGKAYAVRYVLPLVPGAVAVPDGRSDTSVDLVLGTGYAAPGPAAAPAPTC